MRRYLGINESTAFNGCLTKPYESSTCHYKSDSPTWCARHQCEKTWMIQNAFCPKCEEEQHGAAGTVQNGSTGPDDEATIPDFDLNQVDWTKTRLEAVFTNRKKITDYVWHKRDYANYIEIVFFDARDKRYVVKVRCKSFYHAFYNNVVVLAVEGVHGRWNDSILKLAPYMKAA
jgi:hypothetical protein